MDLSNVSILNLMPPNLAANKNVQMLSKAFDEALQTIIAKIPNIAIIPNLVLDQILNEILIDLLAWQFHVDFYDPGMPIEVKKELVLMSLDWHFRKGTPSVVEEIISTVFSKAKIEEWYEYEGHPYRFRVATAEEMPDKETVAKLFRAINSVKNTRSLLENIASLIVFYDEVPLSEETDITLQTKITEDFSKQGKIFYNGRVLFDGVTDLGSELRYIYHNGEYLYNGKMKYGPNRIKTENSLRRPFLFSSGTYQEIFALSFEIGEFKDKSTGPIYYNGTVRHNGEETYKPRGNKLAYEKMFIWVKKHRFYNGVHKYDGQIKADSNMYIPLEC